MLESEFILKLEDSILCNRNPVASRKIVEECLQLFDGFDSAALVELCLGRILIISVAGVESGVFGEFSFGVSGVIAFEVNAGGGVVVVLVVAHCQQIKRFLGFVAAFEH